MRWRGWMCASGTHTHRDIPRMATLAERFVEIDLCNLEPFAENGAAREQQNRCVAASCEPVGGAGVGHEPWTADRRAA
ncbi:hypothetical protein EVAR_63409_1 [Eumeta japonica]|uniref:Uncharacterized protein n=1 Tax=Eumeta variegata TaxID=151549 RepID=A0A4C1Z236_EUMVA|nr:hypothetical protein EVAR_63409_1 [Eumeta japonica]